MIIAGLAAALFTVFAAGFGVTSLLLRRETRLTATECACISWLLGTGMVSLLLWIAGMLVTGAVLQIAVASACIALGLCGWRLARKSVCSIAPSSPFTLVEWILSGVIAFQIVIVFWIAMKHGLGWDGLLNWEIKARYAFLNGGGVPPQYYASSAQALTHPEYPLLIPMTELWIYLWLGDPHQFWVKIIFPIFYAATAILLAITGARLSGRRWSGLLAAALLFFVPYIVKGPGGLIGGYVDLPLAGFYFASAAYLVLSSISDDENLLRVSIACLALLPWIKREGTILWLVAAASTAVFIWRRKKSRTSLLLLLPGAIIILAWRLFLTARGVATSHDFGWPRTSGIESVFERVFPICRAGLAEVAQLDHWSFFWYLLTAAIIYRWFRARDSTLSLLTILIVAPIMLYAGTYLFSAWPDYTAHLRVSFPRLLMHLIPLGWLCIAQALRPPIATTEPTTSTAR